jgi:hypothetical protein
MEIKFVELTQDHVEKFLATAPDDAAKKDAKFCGDTVRAAVKAGWFEVPKIEDVGKLPPSDVLKLTDAIVTEYARIMGASPS